MTRGRSTLIAGIATVLAILILLLLVFLLGRRSAGQPPVSVAATQAPPTAPPAQASGSVPTPRSTPQGGGQPTPTARTGQAILAFNVPATYNCSASPRPAGDLVHLSWTTANATGVSISIDGPGKYNDYPASGSADVPFACSEMQHTYLLTTQGSGAPATRTVTIRRA